jgi:hypothetical protein
MLPAVAYTDGTTVLDLVHTVCTVRSPYCTRVDAPTRLPILPEHKMALPVA